jgi:hypothetical protein
MADDWTQEPGVPEWIEDAKTNIAPMIDGTAFVMTLVPEGEPDIKFAVELGLSIMLNKPIVTIRRPGTKLSEKLAQVADADLELDLTNPSAQQIIHAFLNGEEFKAMLARYGVEPDE